MNPLYLVIFFFPMYVFGVGLPMLPIKQVEAENIDFNEKILTLTGNVSVAHEIGTIHCKKGILHLNDAKTSTNDLAVNEIFLNESVVIDFSDGSQLMADEGQLDCTTMEGVFTAQTPSKVVYISYAQNGHQKIPVRASSRVLRAKIIKTPQGYSLSTLKGEGAVNIEYLRPLDMTDEGVAKQEKSE